MEFLMRRAILTSLIALITVPALAEEPRVICSFKQKRGPSIEKSFIERKGALGSLEEVSETRGGVTTRHAVRPIWEAQDVEDSGYFINKGVALSIGIETRRTAKGEVAEAILLKDSNGQIIASGSCLFKDDPR